MNMMTTLNLRALVTNDNGEPKTTSYAVAEAFNKSHSHVMRDIKKIIKQCGEEFAKSNFGLTFENKKIGNTERKTPFFRISKDGFMLLVMGFTGEKAMKTKIEFINAFNWMANQLSQVFQSKWARYNSLTNYHQGRKAQISGCASAMGQWRWEKEPLENEIKELEYQLQPQLDLNGGLA
ncbi:Rha family transcriptional regulator [Acinetobacter baumannii]